MALGQSQEEFAELVGVTDQSISDYENGRSQPSRNRLARLARQVGIPVTAFGKGGQRPSSLLQRPAGGRTYAAAGSAGTRASDSATASVVREGTTPTSQEALEILELKMKLAVKENRLVTREEMLDWLRLAELATRPDAAGGGVA